MKKPHRSHDAATAAMFRADPALAADYLNDVLASGDEVDLMLAIRSLSEAFDDLRDYARNADVSPDTGRHILSEQGSTSIKSLRATLAAMRLKLAV